MIYIGVDPGKSGGMAVIHWDRIELLPFTKATEKEIWKFFSRAINPTAGMKCLIEKVHAMPGQGVTSMFTFGQGYGFLRGCLTAATIPYEEVQPRAWQKALKIKPRDSKGGESKNQFKDRLRGKAQQLFPQESVWERTLGEQRAVCDALLIAEFCRRNS